MRRDAIGIAMAMALVSANAEAEVEAEGPDSPPESEPVDVRVVGPSACPSGATFFELVRARAQHVRAAREGDRATVLRVVFTEQGSSFAGWLAVEDASGATRAREISGTSCDEVASALALVAAISVHPDGTRPAPSPAPPPVTPRVPPANDVPQSQPRDLRVGIGAGAEVSSLAGPVPALRVHVEVGDESRRLLAPAIRLFASVSTAARPSDAADNPSTYRWVLGGLDVCPIRVASGRRATFRPCLEVTAGVLDAEAVVVPDERTRPWIAAAGLARLDVELIGPLRGGLFAFAGLPFLRETYVLPPRELYTPPVIFVGGGGELSARFP